MSVTPADADVKLVSDVMEEFCEVSLYCDFNVSDVAVVQLRVKSSSSSDWVTAYRLNANNNSESWHTEYQVGYSFTVSYRISQKFTSIHHLPASSELKINF